MVEGKTVNHETPDDQDDLVTYIKERIVEANKEVDSVVDGMVEFLHDLIVYINSKDLKDIKKDLSDTEFLIDTVASKKDMLEMLRGEYADLYLMNGGDKDAVLAYDTSLSKLFSLFYNAGGAAAGGPHMKRPTNGRRKGAPVCA